MPFLPIFPHNIAFKAAKVRNNSAVRPLCVFTWRELKSDSDSFISGHTTELVEFVVGTALNAHIHCVSYNTQKQTTYKHDIQTSKKDRYITTWFHLESYGSGKETVPEPGLISWEAFVAPPRGRQFEQVMCRVCVAWGDFYCSLSDASLIECVYWWQFVPSDFGWFIDYSLKLFGWVRVQVTIPNSYRWCENTFNNGCVKLWTFCVVWESRVFYLPFCMCCLRAVSIWVYCWFCVPRNLTESMMVIFLLLIVMGAFGLGEQVKSIMSSFVWDVLSWSLLFWHQVTACVICSR